MARKAKGWRNNRSDIPEEPGRDNARHPDHDGETNAGEPETKPAESKRKPKQQHLPTMEPPRIPKIDKLADRYVEHRDARMAKLEEETAAKDLLWASMIEAGLKHYEYDGKVIEIVSEEKIKVKKKKPEVDEDGEDADE